MRHMKKRTDNAMDFDVYNFAYKKAEDIFAEIGEISKGFPIDKVYLGDLSSKHSKLVCSKLEEAWRMKAHRTLFLDKLSEAAQAASKTQDILKYASKNNHIDREFFEKIDAAYENIFEDISSILCDGNEYMNYPEDNGKRGSAYGNLVAVVQ